MAGAGLLAGLLAVLVVYVVDPTGLIGARWPRAWSACEPGIRVEDRRAVPYLMAMHKPETVILGTSKVVIGISEGDAVEAFGPSVVNLGVFGASFDEVAALLEGALAADGVERALVGLDFGMFYGEFLSDAISPAQVREARDLAAAALRPGLFDPVTALAALRTVLSPEGCAAPLRSRRGFLPPDTERLEETYALDRARFERAALSTDRTMRVRRTDDRGVEQDFANRMDRLSALVRAAGARGMHLTLIVGPMHPRYLESLRRAGLADRYAHWREELRRRYAGAEGPGPVLVDLTDHPSFLGDAGQCLDSGAAGCGFLDLLHYRPAVGKAILDIALRAGRAKPAGPQ